MTVVLGPAHISGLFPRVEGFIFFSFPRLQWVFTIALMGRVLAVLQLLDYRFFFHRKYRERVCFFHTSSVAMASSPRPVCFLGTLPSHFCEIEM